MLIACKRGTLLVEGQNVRAMEVNEVAKMDRELGAAVCDCLICTERRRNEVVLEEAKLGRLRSGKSMNQGHRLGTSSDA